MSEFEEGATGTGDGSIHACWQEIPGTASTLGESPFWDAGADALWWCDIDGRALKRWQADGHVSSWPMPSEPGCAAPADDGRIVVALRHAVCCFDPGDGTLEELLPAPYDTTTMRFNDGRCDPAGRFLAGTIREPRDAPLASLWAIERSGAAGWRSRELIGGVVTANGLAFSPDGLTAYWADTRGHQVFAFDYAPDAGLMSNRRLLAGFAPRDAVPDGQRYGGRPDGASVDEEGGYWVAMYEGARVLRILPCGTIDRVLPFPVACPTMVCFGGPDRRTLYATSARAQQAPADGGDRVPKAGSVFRLRVDLAGLPTAAMRMA